MKLGGDEYVYYHDGCDGFTCIHVKTYIKTNQVVLFKYILSPNKVVLKR